MVAIMVVGILGSFHVDGQALKLNRNIPLEANDVRVVGTRRFSQVLG